MDALGVLTSSLERVGFELAQFLPRLLWSVLILIAGWILARFVQRGLVKLLKWVRLDIAAERSGVEDFLLKGGVRFTTVTLIGVVVYWLLVSIAVLAALDMLGFSAAAELFNRAMLYVPSVIIAVVVIIFGSLIAKVTHAVLYAYLNNIGIGSAGILSAIAQYAILVFVIFVALEHLSIGGAVLVSAFQIAFGSACLAAALAFGLGGRDLAAKILEAYWKQRNK